MGSFRSAAAATLAAVMAFVAHAAEADKCGGGCVPGRAEFCGLDDQCHIYSCQTWYEFGPRSFTGNDNASSTPLTCQDIQVTEPYQRNDIDTDGDVYYPSVAFRCRSLTPEPIAMGFTKRCTTSGPNTGFTCYELAESTDFQPFLDEVSASGLNCTDDDELDETGYPKFSYAVTYVRSGAVFFVQGHNDTSEFNETLALNGTMYASYRESTAQPTAAPTASPSLSPSQQLKPTLTTSSAFSNKRQTISTVATLLGVTVLVSVGL